MHFRAIFGNRFPRLCRGQFRRRAVFIRGAQEQHFVAAPAQIAGIEVRRQLAAHKITQMFDPVDIRNGGGDKVARHDLDPETAFARL